VSTEIDPNRLLMVIKERHILVERLKKLLVIAKTDNKGDAFKINRLYLYHKNELGKLEDRLREKVVDDRRKKDRSHQDWLKEEEAAVHRLRLEIERWNPNGDGNP